ncbi:MAG: hypothetical protein ABSF38_11200 [Verrucomicrobiota bacterium]|jgi:hypothetical protein
MSAQEQMARLLQQWLRMTRAESAAIRAEAWPKVEAIQTDKARLQQPLNEARRAWKAEAGTGLQSALAEKPFRAAIGRLIALEEHNARLVAAHQQKARARQLHLGRAARNLLMVKKSYAPEAPVAWNLVV